MFSGSGSLGGANAPVVNLSSEYFQNSKATALLQSGAQVTGAGGFAGDDSKVQVGLFFVSCFMGRGSVALCF